MEHKKKQGVGFTPLLYKGGNSSALWGHRVFLYLMLAASGEKSALEHAQNAQIQIILRMRKVSAGLCSTFIHYVVSTDSESGQ